MQAQNIYKSISERTNGNVYIGVVGPVRTGKSTFIKRFMDLMVLPYITEEFKRERARDELPQSASGRTIMTTEPKFVPEEAVRIDLENDLSCNVRLVDCVGFMIDGVEGLYENEMPRMVSTPWSEKQMPFSKAAEIGTEKVINDHSTIGIVLTTDGTATELPRDVYIPAEERVIGEMKRINKPFVIVVNSANPTNDQAIQLKQELQAKYDAPVEFINCKTMQENDILQVLSRVINEFPIGKLIFKIPGWISALGSKHWITKEILHALSHATEQASKLSEIRNIISSIASTDRVKNVYLDNSNIGDGETKIAIEVLDDLFYKVIGEETGIDLEDDRKLVQILKELIQIKNEYSKISEAIEDVRSKGYGIVTPQFDELSLEQPEMIKQGNRFGIKLKASAPSIHMIRCDVETEIAPLVGTEKQSEELIAYLMSEFEDEPDKIWESDMFGKSLNDIVTEGLNNKVFKMPEDSQNKLRETLERMVNESNGSMVCIII